MFVLISLGHIAGSHISKIAGTYSNPAKWSGNIYCMDFKKVFELVKKSPKDGAFKYWQRRMILADLSIDKILFAVRKPDKRGI